MSEVLAAQPQVASRLAARAISTPPLRWLAVCAVLVVACSALGEARAGDVAPPGDDPRAWIERMMRATRTLNYLGTFVYRRGDLIESMRIIHRSDAAGERERLVSLTGAAREVLRDADRVTCILPDDQAVVVAKRGPSRAFKSSPVLDATEGFTHYYSLSAQPGERVAGRATRQVHIEPQDAYRYGYRLSLDHETGLLLKSELIGERSATLEEIVYTTLDTPEHIPDEWLEPESDSEGYTWIRDDRASNVRVQGPAWSALERPVGFDLHDSRVESVGRKSARVRHLVYSDGLATVSVYVERIDEAEEPLEGLSAMGAINAYGTMVEGHQITVVGEVPARTVELIGRSVQRK